MKHLERAYTGNNALGWYAITLCIIFFAQFLLSATSILGLGVNLTPVITPGDNLFDYIDKNLFLLVLLIPFTVSLLIFGLLSKTFHYRSIIEVINGRKKLRWNRIWSGFFIWLLFISFTTLVSYLLCPEDFALQFNLSKFIPLLIISIIFIPLQATFEEVIFRGYLMQGIGTFTGYRWIALLVSSILFMLLHMRNPEVGRHGTIMFFNYMAMALIWGIITLLDDGAEIPIGMHVANNLFICLFTSQRGAVLETDAIFEVSESDPYISLAVLTVAGLLIIAYFYRKYQWNFSILNKKLDKPTDNMTSVS